MEMRPTPRCIAPDSVAVAADRRTAPTSLPEKTGPLPPRQPRRKRGFYAINTTDQKPRESPKRPDCEMRDHRRAAETPSG